MLDLITIAATGGVLLGTIILGYVIERAFKFSGAINTGWLWS